MVVLEILNLAAEVAMMARMELLLFTLAVGAYFALFKGVLPQNEKLATKRSREEVDEYERDPLQGSRRGADPPIPDPAEHESLARAFQNAFERGDHRTVLRCWNASAAQPCLPHSHVCLVCAVGRCHHGGSLLGLGSKLGLDCIRVSARRRLSAIRRDPGQFLRNR